MTRKKMNARQLINKLEIVEVSSQYGAQTRDMMMQERFAVLAALKSGNRNEIGEAINETMRVAQMWDVKL